MTVSVLVAALTGGEEGPLHTFNTQGEEYLLSTFNTLSVEVPKKVVE